MIERAIESWTDTVSERSYQSVFCQMLVARGFTILHSTRHCALEFGKDIIARDSDGTLCAFQLKGHPGGRLSKGGFSELLPQIGELTDIPVNYPGVPSGTRHKAFLVTNGEIDEEVHVAVTALNGTLQAGQRPAQSLEVISRGTFLAWAKQLESSLWPSELGDWQILFRLLSVDGRSDFPTDDFDHLVTSTIGLSPALSSPSQAEVERRVASAALITAVALRQFSARTNHFAEASAWALFALYAVATCERHQVSTKRTRAAIDAAEEASRTALIGLAQEVVGSPVPGVQGDGFSEFVIYRARLTLLAGCLGLLWWFLNEKVEAEAKLRDKLGDFVTANAPKCELWGEGAVPQIVLALLCLTEVDPTSKADTLIDRLLGAVIKRCLGDGEALWSPYWRADQVLLHSYRELLALSDDELAKEKTKGSSFSASALLQLSARRNLRTTCRSVWASFTKLTHRQFVPEKQWQALLFRCENGDETGTQVLPHGKWDELVSRSYEAPGGHAALLKERPFLLGFLTVLFPFRFNADVLRGLCDSFKIGWKM